MRATVELHENSAGGLPPVKAKVTLGKEDLSILVRGGFEGFTFVHIQANLDDDDVFFFSFLFFCLFLLRHFLSCLDFLKGQ